MPDPALPRTPIVEQLDGRLSGPGSAAIIEAHELASLGEQTGLDARALTLASLAWARRWARAPVSNFEVGAVALASSGKLYLGANIEFRHLPLSQTIHAEQAVIAHAWAGREDQLTLLATSAAPCGFCRQFMLELPEPRPQIQLVDRAPMSLDELLPAGFGPEGLGRTPQLLRAGPHPLKLLEDDSDPLARAALDAARRSSAPYTGALSGVAVATADGRVFCGALAESVAYNPTLAPMQAALISAHHGGARLESIVSACLVELDGAAVSQCEQAWQVLASVAPGARTCCRLARLDSPAD